VLAAGNVVVGMPPNLRRIEDRDIRSQHHGKPRESTGAIRAVARVRCVGCQYLDGTKVWSLIGGLM
jgi:hypothetical protein